MFPLLVTKLRLFSCSEAEGACARRQGRQVFPMRRGLTRRMATWIGGKNKSRDDEDAIPKDDGDALSKDDGDVTQMANGSMLICSLRYSGDHRRQTLPALSTRAVSMDTLDHSAGQVGMMMVMVVVL